MRMKPIIGIVVLAVLTAAWYAIPRPLVGSSYKLDYVEYHGETIDFHDECSRAEREEIEALLRTYKRSAVPVPFRRWFGDDYIHLTGGDGHRPLHILLSDGGGGGKTCYRLYSSAEKGGYSIRDGESLRAALEKMLAQ